MNRELELLLLTFNEPPSQSYVTGDDRAEVLAALEKHLPEILRDLVVNEVDDFLALVMLTGNSQDAVKALRNIAWKRSLPVLDDLWAKAKANERAELRREHGYQHAEDEK